MSVRKIVSWVDAPFVACTMMMSVADTIHGRIAQVHVGRAIVDLGSQRFLSVLEFAILHSFEEVKILFDTTTAIRTVFAFLVPTSTIFANFLKRQIANVSFTVLDQLYCPIVELVEVV